MSKPINWTFVTSKQVWMDKSLSIEAKAIWHILSAWRDHETGESYPTVWTLQQVSGMGRNKVDKALTELVKAGAITRRLERHQVNGVFAGCKAIYTVTKLSQWVGKNVYTKDTGLQFTGAPVHRRPGNQRVSVSHPISLNHPQSLSHPLSPDSPAQTGLRLTEPELERLLEGSGIGASEARVVWERFESMSWLDAQGRPFRYRKQIASYAAGLADRIEACKMGE